jgi:diaminopimelate decarboxylase
MSKKAYVRPVLVKQVAGVMNKFGNSSYRDYRDTVDGVKVESLIKNFGSPLFVLSQRKTLDSYRRIYSAFSTRYPNVKMAWPYKTNYLGAVCATLHKEGAFAEVVSEFEYRKAKKLGVQGSSIILNGPYKPADLLKQAIADNCMINVDNFDELYLIEMCAREIDRKVPLGIRINFEAGLYTQWNKFGFSFENGQAREAVSRIARSRYLTLRGLHTHIGTFVLEPQAYISVTEKLVNFMQDMERDYHFEIEYIDIGGGFPSRNRLKGIYLSPDVAVPGIDEYADGICNTLLRCLHPKEYPVLYIESGRAVIDESGFLITTVYARKQLADGTRCYLLDAGINLLPTSVWYNHLIQPDRQLAGIPEPCRLYGPLCMNIDVIADAIYLPPLPVGGRLVISPVGAYNMTQWMQFITCRPAVVMIMENGSIECIRRAETLDDINRCESIPQSLHQNP